MMKRLSFVVIMAFIVATAAAAWATQATVTAPVQEFYNSPPVNFRNGTTIWIERVDGYAEHAFRVDGQITNAATYTNVSGTYNVYTRLGPDTNWLLRYTFTTNGGVDFVPLVCHEIKHELIVRKNRAAVTSAHRR